MRNPFPLVSVVLVVAISFSPMLRAQAARPSGAATPQGLTGSQTADLSGDWASPILVRLGGLGGSDTAGGNIGASASGQRRGKDDGVPYQPWAMEKMMSEVSPTGNEASFVVATDPNMKYWEP